MIVIIVFQIYLSSSVNSGITSTKYPVLLGTDAITFVENIKLKLEKGLLNPLLLTVPNVPCSLSS